MMKICDILTLEFNLMVKLILLCNGSGVIVGFRKPCDECDLLHVFYLLNGL